jgi:glycosyltransferase involved in cell wall biosynthesis
MTTRLVKDSPSNVKLPLDANRMRVAIIHYWLLGMRGGEKVLEALCRILPRADIFTLFYDPERISPAIKQHRITPSYLNPLRRFHRSLLPLMPRALESFDLRPYDLIISSESGPAKGVIANPNARHICYCHTPMRYLWDLYPQYLNEWTRSPLKRAAIKYFAPRLREWDLATAERVTEFVANSENVRGRIQRIYNRDSVVVHPPVAVESFRHEPAEDYFLMVSELVPYKRVDLAVRTFAGNGRKLRIAGDGPEYANLKKIASPNIQFLGRVSDSDLQNLYARCRAFVMPGEEDFGITIVEALASGKAVIALSRGGALEIVPPEGAFFFEAPNEELLNEAIHRFESSPIDAQLLQSSAKRFSPAEFDRKIRDILNIDSRQ